MEGHYKLHRSQPAGEVDSVLLAKDNVITSIPMVESNMDYRIYLEWVAQGNEPLPAD